MTIDFTKPVQLKDGTEVTIISTEGRRGTYCIIGYIGSSNILSEWDVNGKLLGHIGDEFDLISVPEKK